MFMIPSRTKLESFNSFGSHAQLLQLFMENFHILYLNVMNLSSLLCLYSTKNENGSLIKTRVFGGLMMVSIQQHISR